MAPLRTVLPLSRRERKILHVSVNHQGEIRERRQGALADPSRNSADARPRLPGVRARHPPSRKPVLHPVGPAVVPLEPVVR